MRHLALPFLAALILGVPPAPAAVAGLTVLRSDTAVLEVEWTTGDVSWESVPGTDGRTFRRPHVAGTLHEAGAGEPDVPSVVELVGIPRRGTPRVRVVSVETSAETVRDLAPGPEPVLETPATGEPWYSERRTVLTERTGPFPAAWAEITGTSSVRGQRVARLVLHPWRYEVARGELLTATRLVVRVEFGTEGAVRSASPVREQPQWEDALGVALLNADVARGWRAVPQGAGPRGSGDSFDSAPTWLKVPITKTGVYRLDYFTFANVGVDPAQIDPSTVRVFSGTNLPLEESYATPPPPFMTECALSYQDADPVPDGIFDLDDYFLLYALAPNGWANEYDAARPRTEYVENPYTDVSSYWITWGGSFSAPPKRMASRAVPPDGSPPAAAAPYRLHFEQNNVEDFRYRDEDGWQWENLQGRGRDRLYLLQLDRVAPAGDGVITARILSWGSDSDFTTRDVELKVGGEVVADSVWNHGQYRAVVDLTGCFQGLLTEGQNSIRVNAKTSLPTALDRVYTTWFDVEYGRSLEAASGSYLKFFSDPFPPAGVDSTCNIYNRYGKETYVLQGFHTSQPDVDIHLLDVTDQHDVVRLTGFSSSVTGSLSSITFTDSTLTAPRWYVATTLEGVQSLPPAEVVELAGLRSTANGADYLVIYHPDFREGAERLAGIRYDAGAGLVATMVVDVNDIYDEFSWGMTDPVAMRDFLAYAAANWSQGSPLYVTLMGDASYDTKGYLEGSPQNYVGTYTGRYRTEGRQYVEGSNINFYSTDDFFGYLETADYSGTQEPGLDVAIGRYPVSSVDDLDVVLDKLDTYVAYSTPGQWQNRYVLAADDERTLTDYDENYHTVQVETLARERVPPAMDKVKVYLTEFPRNDFGKKPEAQAKFIEEFTRGALMVTYTGHGDQNTMAQEEVFVSQKIPELLNESRYTVFSTFSCTVSRFDLLSGNSLAELILFHPDGGAVSTFASAGLVFGAESAVLNQEWLGEMFGTPYPVNTTARRVRSIGLSAMLAKAIVAVGNGNRVNNEKYVLLGDPALEVRYGRYLVDFDSTSVHTQFVDSDSLRRVVRGWVKDEQGRVLDGTMGTSPFDGVAYVHVSGQADTSGYSYTTPAGAARHIDYTLEGPTVYRGEIPVHNGALEVRFPVSEAVQSGNRARISVFALEDGPSRDASGATDSLYVEPSIRPDDVDDSQGPIVRIAFEGYDNFVDGDFLFTDKPVLTVEIEDESGVNLLPYPEFARLAAELDDRDRVDLAEDFTYEDGTFTRGRVRRILPLAPGKHTLEVKAFDNVGNRGSAKVDFSVVLPTTDFDIVDRFVAVYPNPFVNATDFLFRLTHDAEVDLKVFTITGRKIWETGPFPASKGENRVHWEGRDENDRVLANGTYLFKVEATFTSPDEKVQSDEFIGHVVKMR